VVGPVGGASVLGVIDQRLCGGVIWSAFWLMGNVKPRGEGKIRINRAANTCLSRPF
jgi:hypothetical protein